MLNRRLIRIKVFQAFYAYTQDESPSLNKSKSYLHDSIHGIAGNFLTVLLFPLELVHYVRHNLNPEDYKYLPSEQDKFKHDALMLNGLYEQLVRQPFISNALERPIHNWQISKETLRSLYKEIVNTRFFKAYVKTDYNNFDNQVEFLLKLYDYLGTNSEAFNLEMEEIEMLWEDEKIPILKAIKLLLSDLKLNSELTMPRLSKEEEDDEVFANQLLIKSVRNQADFEDLIAKATPGWDKDRIARADMILMVMALTEMQDFPYIPIKVSMNEYLELAKNYSTPQSSKFVNGILDKLTKKLKEENKVEKKGRGMIG
ncbi:MAG: N utilization substance protein B [Bacteroidia bacterium]|jgi:N utilization substance protein B